MRMTLKKKQIFISGLCCDQHWWGREDVKIRIQMENAAFIWPDWVWKARKIFTAKNLRTGMKHGSYRGASSEEQGGTLASPWDFDI
jgi:hypothetical protein